MHSLKTIAELQQDIRLIKKDIAGIDKRLDDMSNELAYYKSTANDESEYKRILMIAKTMPILNHPIAKESIATKNNYFGLLLMIGTIDDSLNENQLLFLQRMILGDLTNNSQLDNYLGKLGTIQKDDAMYKMSETIISKYSDILLVDSMIIANLSKANSREAYKIISSIAVFLKKDSRHLRQIAQVAYAILTQDVNVLPVEYKDIISLNTTFGFYLCEIEEWKLRVSRALKKEEEELRKKRVSKTAYFHQSEEDEYGDNWYYYKD